jgi:serine/threonine protein kinase
MADRPIAPGDVIAGRYRVESILGEGGMGVVLGARNTKLDERVAIKVLEPEAANDAEAVARFFREARAAVRMKGVHVAK